MVEADHPFTGSLRKYRPFQLFWCARVATIVAFQMLGVAVGWQIYALTGSAWYLGLVGLVQFLPLCLLTLVVGHVADRYDRRVVARICQVVEAVAAAALAAASFGGWQTEESILAFVLLGSTARAFEGPAMQALLPGLVPVHMIPTAAALSATAMQTASILGPAVGGFLYAAGPTVPYGISALLFAGAALFLTLIPMERQSFRREPISLSTLFAGISFIRSKPAILGAISLDLFAVLLGGATALLPIYARDILHTGPWGLGMLRAAPGVGALAMSILLARHSLKRRVGQVMFTAVAIFGAATVVFALSRSFLLSLVVLVVMGGADVISVVIRSALVQIQTPDEMRGRVSAVNSLFIGTSNQLGEFESGATAALFGTVPAVVIGGVGTMVVVLLWIRLFPELARVDSLDR